MKKATMIEAALERRNHYLGRMVENMVNIIYFGKRKEKFEAQAAVLKEKALSKDAKKSTENVDLLQKKNVEIVQAQKAMDIGEGNIEDDEMLIKSFDELLKTLTEPKAKN